MLETNDPEVAPTPAVAVAFTRRSAWRSKVQWFAAEIVVVVAGILIALALNAWWGAREEARAAASLRSEFRRDIEQTRTVIAENLESSRALSEAARAVLSGMAAKELPSRDTHLATIGSIFI